MTALMEAVVAQLSSLPAQVVRGWPQELVTLPSCTAALLEDRQQGEYGRMAAVALTLRAVTPEEADALAESADALMRSQGWRRTACRDGAEKDGSCFHKALRYDLALPGEERISLTLSGTAHTAQVIRREWVRPATDRTGLSDTAVRLSPGPVTRRSLRLRLDPASAPALFAAMQSGERVALEGAHWLITSAAGQTGAAEATLHETM